MPVPHIPSILYGNTVSYALNTKPLVVTKYMQIQVEHLEALVKVLHFSAKYVSAAVIVAALLMASSFLVEREVVLLGGIDTRVFGVAGYLLAVILGLWLLISMIRR